MYCTIIPFWLCNPEIPENGRGTQDLLCGDRICYPHSTPRDRQRRGSFWALAWQKLEEYFSDQQSGSILGRYRRPARLDMGNLP